MNAICGKRIRLREAVYKRGKYDDVIVMSALRSEWIARKKEK